MKPIEAWAKKLQEELNMSLDKKMLEQLDHYAEVTRNSTNLVIEAKVRQIAYEYIIQNTPRITAYKRAAYINYFNKKLDRDEHK